MATTLSRRSFIKTGLIGALALATAGGLYRATRPALPAGFVLDDEAHSALSAIIPVVLKDAIDSAPASLDNALMRVRDAIVGLPLATQKEIQDLFALLTLAPTRRFIVGLGDDWQHAKPADVAEFLQNWRMSRLGLLQSAYQALHDLITGSWYGSESSWEAIGYPGPIKELS
ncbi:MAG TPA: twin-arginine translocation signal domain-containing protein [Noviherbaspirillum sp.]|nr:twin-arginine translocation signal domain-containing protein [Noviherbaspirillum sp.]